MEKPLVIVAGPTASGKSSLSIRLATDLDGEIINLDSVQIYQDFEIGAAQPTNQEKQIVRHHLYGTVKPTEKISVGRYLKLFAPVKQDLLSRSKIPFIVGGTSLYIQAILSGLSDLPEDLSVRRTIETMTNVQMYERLLVLDPDSLPTIHQNDRVRLSRALEVAMLGLKISDAHFQHRSQMPHPAIIIVPMLARDELYKKINARTELMIKNGLLEEVLNIQKNWGTGSDEVPGLRSIGYQEAATFLKNSTQKLSELADQISQSTRRFAKRQMTWLRNEPQKQGWIIRPTNTDATVALESAEPTVPISKRRQAAQKTFNVWDIDYETLKKTLSATLKENPSTWQSPVQVWFVPARNLM